MFIIVMHNNQEYLSYLTHLAEENGITDTRVMNNAGMGVRLLGGDATLIFSRGKATEAYDKAFVARINGEEKARSFLETIKQDDYLDRINMNNKGFICTVPLQKIGDYSLQSADIEKGDMMMKISDYLTEGRIMLDIKSESKEEAIREISQSLKDAPEISNFDKFISDVFLREKLQTTGIGNEVAIPHARTDTTSDFVIAFGRSKKGVGFASVDGKPVKLIFLMGTPDKKKLSAYLKILGHLSRVLNREDFRKELFAAASAKDIIEAFRKIES